MAQKLREKEDIRFTVALTATALVAVAALAFLSVYSSDDFWYATFFDHGLSGYFALMREHYQLFNGRVLVHVVVQLLLHLGSWAYALTCAGLCLWMPQSGALAEGRSRQERWMTAALFHLGILLMPLAMIREGMFWRSAFCNYVLPTAMICSQFFLLQRMGEREGCDLKTGALLCVYAFCCGATTEQSGIVAVLVLLYYFLAALIRRRLRTVTFLQVLCALAGVLTVFLSPATQGRTSAELNMDAALSMGERLVQHFSRATDLLAENGMPVLLLALTLLLVGVLAGQRMGKKWPVLCGALPAGLAVVLFPVAQARFWLFLVLFVLLVVSAVILLILGRETTAGLLLCAVASVAVMLPTNSVAARTLLPFYLYLLVAVALLAGELLRQLPKPWRIGLPLATAVLTLVMLAPTVAGFWYNYRLDMQNRWWVRVAAESGQLRYCMDYDMDYTWRKPYSEAYIYLSYLDSVGLEENTKVYFYSQEMPNVYVKGEQVGFPAPPQATGGYFLPLRGVIETLGGSIGMNENDLAVTLFGQVYILDFPVLGTARLVWTDMDGNRHEMTGETSLGYYTVCLEEKFFTQCFGLRVVHRDAGRIEVSATR